jgi:hypothetical protein
MATPSQPPHTEPALETAFDVDPPTPVEARRYRILLQLWIVMFLVILVTGFLNYLWGFVDTLRR